MDAPQNLMNFVLLSTGSLFSFFVGYMTCKISAHSKNASRETLQTSRDDSSLSFDERILTMVNLAIGKDAIRIEHFVNEGYYALWIVPDQTDLRTLTGSNSIRISRNLFNKIGEIINEFKLKEKEKEVAQRLNDRALKEKE